MKLYKKAAACLLTAAMALSMLTACGGGGGTPGTPSTPSTPGTPGSSTPSTLPTPDQIVLPGGEGGDESTETKPAKTPIADVNSSKLAKFNKKYTGAKEFYVELLSEGYDENGTVYESMVGRAARKNDAIYTAMTISEKNQKPLSVELLRLKEGKFQNEYLLFSSSKAAVKLSSREIDENSDASLDILITHSLPSQMWSTKVKVGPTEYDAEIYYTNTTEITTCFAANGDPVYQFIRFPGRDQVINSYLYKTIQAGSGTSKGLCEMPSGTKTYSFDQHAYTLTDANGNKFTLQPETNSAGETNGFIILDKDGKDVTADFKWVNDFYQSSPKS